MSRVLTVNLASKVSSPADRPTAGLGRRQNVRATRHRRGPECPPARPRHVRYFPCRSCRSLRGKNIFICGLVENKQIPIPPTGRPSAGPSSSRTATTRRGATRRETAFRRGAALSPQCIPAFQAFSHDRHAVVNADDIWRKTLFDPRRPAPASPVCGGDTQPPVDFPISGKSLTA